MSGYKVFITLKKSIPNESYGFFLSTTNTNTHVVRNIQKFGIAERSGLEDGDLIIKINGVFIHEKLNNQEALMLAKKHPFEMELLVLKQRSEKTQQNYDGYSLSSGISSQSEESSSHETNFTYPALLNIQKQTEISPPEKLISEDATSSLNSSFSEETVYHDANENFQSSRIGSIQTLNTTEGLEPSRYQDVPAQKSSKKIRFLPFLKLPKRGSEADENNLTSVSSAGFNDSFNISTPKPEISTPKPEIFTSAVSEAVNHRLNTYYYGIETQKFAYRKNIQELACPLRREQIAIQLKTIRQDVECLNLEENDELGYSSPYENAYKNGFQTAATMIHTLNDEVKRNNAISVIEGILKNILKNPKEKKFRRIKIAEKAFQENLKPAKGAVEFLKVVGFREEFHAGEKETFLYLQKQIPKEETLAKISYALEILRAK